MVRTLLLLLLLGSAFADDHASWRRPFPAHKIADNLYYVGTEDLACFLIATSEGHILINTGLEDSTLAIRASIQKMGYKLEDVKILLNMQAHYDHVAAMHEIQQLTGAKVYATEADAPVLEDGGKSDPYLGKEYWFKPVKVDHKLHDGEVIRLGGTELTVITTPGHTKGSVTYTMTAMDHGKKRSIAIANMGSVIMPLVGNAKYPKIVEDFEQTFAKQRNVAPEIWVAGHASQYNMAAKYKAGSFVDPEGYKKAVASYEGAFRERLAKERRK